MTKSELEGLFEKISKERPSKLSLKTFDDHPDRQ